MAEAPNKSKIACSKCGQHLDVSDLEPFSKVNCPICGTKLLVPMIIGNYQLLAPLGSGGMGTVYKAYDCTLQRFVAIKLMKKELAADTHFVEDFTREARAAAALNHPNIAQILSFGKIESQYYLVMELLEGGSLDNKIEQKKRVGEQEVLDIGIQVASALRAAHQRGLIHRDIKPGNILFNLEGQARVVDFGLARFAEGEEEKKDEDGIWGTPYYIAPEKLNGEKEDFRSDMYSLGGTMFHALAGRAPFEADSATEVVLKRLKTPALSLKTFAPDICDDTAQIIGTLLRQNREERFTSYDELIADLQQAKHAAVLHAQNRGKPQAQPRGVVANSPGEPPVTWKGLVGTGIVFVACLVVGFAIWHYRHVIFGSPDQDVVTTQAAKPTTTAPVVDSQAWLEAWDAGDRSLAAGQYPKALASYTTAEELLRKNPAKHAVIQCQIGVTQLLSGKSDAAKAAFTKAVLDGAGKNEETVTAHNYGSVLAQLMVGDLKLDKAETMIAKPMPAVWTLAQFYLGAQSLAQGNLKDAEKWLQGYVKATDVADLKWVTLFQPHVRTLAAELENVNSAASDASKLRLSGSEEEANARIKGLADQVKNPLIRAALTGPGKQDAPAVATISAEDVAKAAAKAAQQKKELEALKKQRDQHVADAQVVEQSATAVAPLLAECSFEAAAQQYTAIADKIQTASLKEIATLRTEMCNRLDAMKKEAISGMPKSPYARGGLTNRRGGALMGKPSAADATTITFSEARGQIMVNWRDCSPLTVLTLLTYYSELANAQNPAARANNFVALAWLSRETQQTQYSAAYANTAAGLAPTAKTEWEKLSGALPAPPELPGADTAAAPAMTAPAAKGGTAPVLDVEFAPVKKKPAPKKTDETK